jgi:hypothetical protein
MPATTTDATADAATDASYASTPIPWGEKANRLQLNEKQLQEAISQAHAATPSYQHLQQTAKPQVKCSGRGCSNVVFLSPSKNQTKTTAQKPERAGCFMGLVSGVFHYLIPFLIECAQCDGKHFTLIQPTLWERALPEWRKVRLLAEQRKTIHNTTPTRPL